MFGSRSSGTGSFSSAQWIEVTDGVQETILPIRDVELGFSSVIPIIDRVATILQRSLPARSDRAVRTLVWKGGG